MNNRNPAKHPLVLAGITTMGVVFGASVGAIRPAYGTAIGPNALVGGVYGLFLGVFIATIWSLVASFFD